MVHPLTASSHVVSNLGVIPGWRAVYGFMTSDWRPEQRYLQNRETDNIAPVSSVGRAQARQSGGRRF